MNKDKVFVTVFSAICLSKGFAESDMDYVQAVNVANCVVEKLFEAELILKEKAAKDLHPSLPHDKDCACYVCCPWLYDGV